MGASSSKLRTVTDARHVRGESLHQGLQRPLCEAVKMEPAVFLGPKMLEMPELRDIYQGEMDQGYETSPRERSVLQLQVRKHSATSTF